MKKYSGFLLLLLGLTAATTLSAQTVKYKCLLQMTNYTGEGAYVVVSLINKEGGYEKTLRVLGPDRKWYPDLKEWHKANSKKPQNLSGITGASVSGGDRSMFTLELEAGQLNSGYKLRFETAVEDKEYFVKDLEVPLTTEGLAGKNEGTGYVRYVRFTTN